MTRVPVSKCSRDVCVASFVRWGRGKSLSSCAWRKSRTIWSIVDAVVFATYFRKRLRSRRQQTADVMAVTVAARGCSRISATSPKEPPRRNVVTRQPSMTMSNSPFSMT